MSLNRLAPGVYIQELSSGIRPIQAVGTSLAGFVGIAPDPAVSVNEAIAVNNWSEFIKKFTSPPAATTSTPLALAVYGFFLNGGSRCYVANIGAGANAPLTAGLNALGRIDEIAIVAAPGYTDVASHEALLSHCELLKDRVAILDAPKTVTEITELTNVGTVGDPGENQAPALRPRDSDFGFGAYYFPWFTINDPLAPGTLVDTAPSGFLAGIWARTDETRGVHKAPANEVVRGALNVTYRVTSGEQEQLNPRGVNVIRFFPREGIRVWGARTLSPSGEYRYLNVRRLLNMIEESIEESMRWVVFEPNDQTLWKSIQRDVSAFLLLLWRDGALMGDTPELAFFVKCDEETNPQESINAGNVVTLIGVAPVKPAEFVYFQISQNVNTAQTETSEAGGAS